MDMKPVEREISIPWHGIVDGYKSMLNAGFEVQIAEDMCAGKKCFDSQRFVTTPSTRD
jgi:hypothetical protein